MDESSPQNHSSAVDVPSDVMVLVDEENLPDTLLLRSQSLPNGLVVMIMSYRVLLFVVVFSLVSTVDSRYQQS